MAADRRLGSARPYQCAHCRPKGAPWARGGGGGRGCCIVEPSGAECSDREAMDASVWRQQATGALAPGRSLPAPMIGTPCPRTRMLFDVVLSAFECPFVSLFVVV